MFFSGFDGAGCTLCARKLNWMQPYDGHMISSISLKSIAPTDDGKNAFFEFSAQHRNTFTQGDPNAPFKTRPNRWFSGPRQRLKRAAHFPLIMAVRRVFLLTHKSESHRKASHLMSRIQRDVRKYSARQDKECQVNQ